MKVFPFFHRSLKQILKVILGPYLSHQAKCVQLLFTRAPLVPLLLLDLLEPLFLDEFLLGDC